MAIKRPQPIHLYATTVTLVGLAALYYGLASRLDTAMFESTAFWVFTVCAIVGELVPIEIPRGDQSLVITVSGTFGLALIIVFGIPGALIGLGAACVIDDIRRRKNVMRTAFNLGQYAISVVVGGLVLEATTHLPMPQHGFGSEDLVGIILAGVAFYAANWSLTSLRIAIMSKNNFLRTLLNSWGPETTTDGLLLGLAPIVVAAADKTLFLLPLMALPMGAAYKNAQISMRNRELAGHLRRQAEENKHLALHDALTGLPNRTLFQERVEQAIRVCRRDGSGLAVMLMDLDRFKEINDALGHHNGDQLLAEIGLRLRALLRDSDTVARLGGDEFAILLPVVNTQEATIKVVDSLLGSFEAPFDLQELTLKVEASIGIATFPDHGTNAGALMRHADVAMYAAKESRLGYQMYQSDRDEHTRDRLALVEELREAIRQDEFVLHYQPKIDLTTDRVVGVEALVRWMHPEQGMIPPDTFIPLAEHTGLIRPLTMWVLDEALQQARRWAEAGIDLTIAVNLSMRNLFDLEVPALIAAKMERWGVHPSKLELEITETSIAADPIRSTKVLNELHEMGVILSIDDFGTGHSSLSRIKRLPVSEIKIDRAFVMNMGNDENDAVIVHSTIDLGRNLGMKVVAEGVEDRASLNKLIALGCDVAQGYFISRPLPANELIDWCRDYAQKRFIAEQLTVHLPSPQPTDIHSS